MIRRGRGAPQTHRISRAAGADAKFSERMTVKKDEAPIAQRHAPLAGVAGRPRAPPVTVGRRTTKTVPFWSLLQNTDEKTWLGECSFADLEGILGEKVEAGPVEDELAGNPESRFSLY